MMIWKSGLWGDMFQVPQPVDGMEGTVDSNPVHFEVQSEEFNFLLQYLYDL